MFGNKPPEWIGKRVTFQQEMDKFGVKDVEAVRVYGSPDLADDVEVTIEMPKKKPRKKKLFRVLPQAAADKNTSDNYIHPEVDPTTGEVKG